MMESFAQFGIAFFLAASLVEIVKILINKKMHGAKGKVLSEEEYSLLKQLYDMHNVKDIDGLPVWYMPRGIAKSLEKIADCLIVLTANQKECKATASRVEKKVTRLTGLQ